MQPYQEAGLEIEQQRKRPLEFASQIAKRAVPLLSAYVPVNLAMKGLSKIDYRLGKFFDHAQQLGYGINEIKDYMTNKFTNQKEEPAKQDRNIIEQYSPELHQFIVGEMKNGRSPLQAGAMAELEAKGRPDFRKIISKITKDHNAPWSAILESTYGQQGAQNSPNITNEQQQNTQVESAQQGAQAGSGQQALMAILDKINQRLGQ